jgi:hypothetical protein
MAKQPLDSWIREALTDQDKEGECGAIALMHVSQGGDKEVHTVRFGAKQHDPSALGKLFRHKAEGYGSELTGVQQFCLCAFYKDPGGQLRSEPEARHPFQINGELDYGGLATEGPNAAGLVSQAMRHNEVLAQTYVRGNSNVIDAQNTLIIQQNAIIGQLLQENHSALEVVKSVMVERMQDDHKFRMEQLQFQRSSGEREKWLKMLPAVVNGFFGREVLPIAAEDTAIVETMATQLTEGQLKALSTQLPPELWGLIAQRMERFLREKREAAERTEALGERVSPRYELGRDSNGAKEIAS